MGCKLRLQCSGIILGRLAAMSSRESVHPVYWPNRQPASEDAGVILLAVLDPTNGVA